MSQYWDRKLSQIYNYSPAYPNVEPVPVDVESATQAPTACVQINRQLIPYLAGLCEVYRNPNFFRGDDARRVKSAEIMNDLQAALLNAGECDHLGLEGFIMPIGTIFYNVSPTAPEGCLAMDGTVYAVDDYPELAALLPSSWDAIYDIGEIGVSGFRLPDMNNTSSYLEAGPVAGDVTGTNSKTVPTSALEPHAHEFPQRQTFNLAVNSGGTPVVLGNQGVLLADTNSAGGNVPMDFRTSRLTTYAYIVAKNLVSENVLDGPAGPTGADGPEGEPGPAGPAGPMGDSGDCDCENVGGVPDDVFIPNTGQAPTNLSGICAGSRRVAQSLREDINLILDIVDAIADSIPPPVRKIKNFPGMGPYLRFLSAMAPALVIALKTQNTLQYEDDLTCALYCCSVQYGGFSEDAFNCWKSNYTLSDIRDNPFEAVGGIVGLDDLVGFSLQFAGSFRSTYEQYIAGVVNDDNYCEANCNCECGNAGGINDIRIDDPRISFIPQPTYVPATDTFEWSPNTWNNLRLIIDESYCITGVDFTGFWSTNANPGPLTFRIGNQEITDASGTIAGEGDFAGSFASQQPSALVFIEATDPARLAYPLRLMSKSVIRTRLP